MICATCLANAEKISPGKSKSAYDFWRASEGNAELQRLKTRLRNEDRMKAVLEPIFKKRREVTSPANGLPLPSTNLISLEALRKAIETYLSCRPELKSELLSKAFFGGGSCHTAGRVARTTSIFFKKNDGFGQTLIHSRISTM